MTHKAKPPKEGACQFEKELYALITKRLDYSSETGIFRWKINERRARKGNIAGSNDGKGYVSIRLNGKNYRAARLAWLYVYRTLPKHYIDHINGNPSDNRISNLRDVTAFENQKNRKTNANNQTGISGVSPYRGGWSAIIVVNNKRIWLGMFQDFFEACCARKSAELEYGFHPNHGRNKPLVPITNGLFDSYGL